MPEIWGKMGVIKDSCNGNHTITQPHYVQWRHMGFVKNEKYPVTSIPGHPVPWRFMSIMVSEIANNAKLPSIACLGL